MRLNRRTDIVAGIPTTAKQHLTEALLLFRDMNHRYGQTIALTNLGSVQTRIGRHNLAVGQLREALALSRETGVHLAPEAAQWRLTQAARDMAASIGGVPKHMLAIEHR